MAFKSIQTHVSDGTLESVQFSIAFLSTDHLHFYVDDVEITTSTASQGVLVDGVDEYGVTLTAAVPSGAVFKVQRQTPRDNVPHVFSTGAALFTALTTDANNEYLLYVVQETYEQSGQGPFPEITALVGTEYVTVEAGGVRKQITVQDFLASVPGGPQLLADLANTTDPAKGAGMVGTENGSTVQHELRPVVNVGNFGNGTAGIQAAVNYAIANHAREIWFPSGSYTLTCPASEPGTQSYSAAIVIDGLVDCKIHGTNAVLTAGIGGGGADAFAFFRLQRVRNVEICNLHFEGDYSNHSGQSGSRSGGIEVATFDVSNPATDLASSYNINIHHNEFNDIGAALWVVNRNEAMARQLSVYGIKFEHNRGTNAARANNTVSLNYTVGISIKHNRFTNSLQTGTEHATMFIDCSRGCEDGDVSFNYAANYIYGMKAESVVGSGPSSNEDRLSKNIAFAFNELVDIGSPTEAAPGASIDPGAGGTYGIRINGVNHTVKNNTISGISTFTAGAGLQSGIYPLFIHTSGSTYNIDENHITRGQWGIIPSVPAANPNSAQFVCARRNALISQVKDGFIAQARCTFEDNEIYNAGQYAGQVQVAYRTYVKRNKATNCGAADQVGVFYQSENSSSLGYFGIEDNEVIDTRGASAAAYAYSFVSGLLFANTYDYSAGLTQGMKVATAAGNYYGATRKAGTERMQIVGNPSALTVASSVNVASITNVDASTVQINFQRPLDTDNLAFFGLLDNNVVNRRWIPYGMDAGKTYCRFRYIDMAGSPVALPTGFALGIA